MGLSCPLCSATTADQAEYLQHLEQEHGLVDDPGTSSEVADEPGPEPEQWSALPPLELKPTRDPWDILRPGERALATLIGGRPAGADPAATTAALAGGALGVLVLRAVRGKRAVPDPGGRAMVMTSQRVVLIERGEIVQQVELTDINQARVKRSQGLSKWKVVEITSRDRRTLQIEGLADDVADFIKSIPTPE